MVDVIPSFFTKRDFWAMLLPGYTLITIGVFLFFPTLIFSVDERIPVDLLTIVVFIVAGPVAGFMLLQLYYYISAVGVTKFTIKPELSFKRGWRKKFEFRRKYEKLKLECSDEDRKELEELEGRHFFGVSTGIALTLIGFYGLAFFVPNFQSDELLCPPPLIQDESLFCTTEFEIRNAIVLIIIFALAGLLYTGAYYEYHRVQLPLICELINKYTSFWPEICEQTKKREYEELIAETFHRFYNNINECKRALDVIKSEIDLEHDLGMISQAFYSQLKEKISKKTTKMYEELINETFSRLYGNSVACKRALDVIKSEIDSEHKKDMISDLFKKQLTDKISKKREELG